MGRVGLMHIGPVPSLHIYLIRLLPLILATAATMFLGNVCYLYLSVAFIQILKAFTPAVTLLLGVAMRVETFRLPLLASVLLIALGTGAVVVIESGAPSFHWVGLLAFMFSSLSEAVRVVGAQKLLGGDSFNTAEVLLYIGGPTGVLLILCSFLFEAPGIYDPVRGLPLVLNQPIPFLGASLVSFLTNLTSYYTIKTTSSLTFKVAGCLKNLVVAWHGTLVHGDHITGGQLAGYLVSVTGFLMYLREKMKTE